MTIQELISFLNGIFINPKNKNVNWALVDKAEVAVSYYKSILLNYQAHAKNPECSHELFQASIDNVQILTRVILLMEDLKDIDSFLKNPPPTDELQDLQGPGDNT